MFQWILFLITLIPGSVQEHDIHLSVCDIMNGSNEGELEITFKIFYDDLLNAVGLEMGEELPPEYDNADTLIHTYITDNFFLKINDKKVDFKYVESHSYPPAVWTTMKLSYHEPIVEMTVENNILNDLFDDQTNLVNVYIDEKEQNATLDKKTIKHSFPLR